MSKRITVVGGGAAGMMAAICAAEQGAQVTLLEPNERLGKKLNITGKGRCNVTNNADIQGLMANIPRNGKFLYSAFSDFDGRDAMAFFEALGVPLKTERGNRVFPVSDRAFDISGALERRLKRLKVHLVRDRAVSLDIAEEAVRGVRGERGDYPADAVILATGGVSYPATGSTGEGHRMAAQAGHTVTPLRGSLVPLREQGYRCARMQGLSLRNVQLTVLENGKKCYTDFGEMLFTHFGVSGPLVLSASAHMRYFDKKHYRLEIRGSAAPEDDPRGGGGVRHPAPPEGPRYHPGAAAEPAGAAQALPGGDRRALPCDGCHRHFRRREGVGSESCNNGIKNCKGIILCRRTAGCRRLYRRLQPADRLGNRTRGRTFRRRCVRE